MSGSSYSLRLNFLPVAGALPDFSVWRRSLGIDGEARPFDEARRFTLPVARGSEGRDAYWTADHAVEGFDEFWAEPDDNVHLARWILFQALLAAAKRQGLEFAYEPGFHDQLELPMDTYPEGTDLFVLEPYYLKSLQQFGLIADFHFKKNPEVPFSRRVQQRSLSLDRSFRRNVDFHKDKLDRIRQYVERQNQLLSDIRPSGSDVSLMVERNFAPVEAFEMSPRVYSFAGGKTGEAQYPGVRDIGPFSTPPNNPKLLFAFLAEDRQAAVRLANALSGKKKIGSFPGFETLFRTPFEVDSKPVTLTAFTEEEIRRALVRAQADDPCPLTVFILPDKDESRYLSVKSAFTNAGLPNQACTVPLLSSDEELKWSIANIALQMFCKAGGQPWHVKAIKTDTLIVGVSQSHKLNPDGGIERFFAFAVLTDSSGAFQKIRVLSETSNHDQYIADLTTTLGEELGTAAETYRNVVVHASFRLRRDEMATIQDTVEAAAASQTTHNFAVLKINQHTRFFAINPEANSLVPYGATGVRLGGNEFLLWFEGISRGRTTVTKAFPGPTHVQKLWESSEGAISDEELLQDLINLSGANWRGFNARNAPVSVYYCHLVAELVHDFQSRGLPLPTVENLKPWFL